jgi:PEP-CTERM motif
LSAVFIRGGTLDFYDQIFNSAGSVTALFREADISFTGFGTSVAFRLDGGSLPGGPGFVNGTPGIIPVTADRDSSGSTVGFNFVPTPPGTKIPPGTTSSVLVISTDATRFTAGNAAVIDGGSQTVASFQPASVPEPATFVLLGGGLLAFAGIRRVQFGRK